MSDNAKVAAAVLREVPIGRLSSFLKGIKPGSEVAMGDGCGGGCGGGAGCIDQFGHTGLSPEAFTNAFRDKATLKTALQNGARDAAVHI